MTSSMMRFCACLVLTFGVLLTLKSPAVIAAETIPLDGEWRFALDRRDIGANEAWFGRDLADRIKLPGILQAQGYGDEISTNTPWVLSLYDHNWYLREGFQAYTHPGNVKVPFLCQPPRHYVGVAWYQRDIEIPRDWSGKRLALNLERPHWETTVWVDEREIGSRRSLCAPHVYDLGLVLPGKHRLSIRVNNSLIMDYRPDSHSVSDSLGSSWNGVVGKIELTATSPIWIEDVQAFPNAAKKSVRINVTIGNTTGQSGRGTLRVGAKSAEVTWDEKGGTAELEVPMGNNVRFWDEFSPYLYDLTITLHASRSVDSRSVRFGLREFTADGNQFVLNGHPINLRGTHNGGDFPLTGYPPTDVESWKRIYRTCREWGLNHMRFHSWCPPEAAFIAADEVGFYLQPECGMWNEISPGSAMERMLYEETDAIIRAYGNHPSFMLLSPSNEPKGHWKESLPHWVERYRHEDPRRLYTTGTGWSLIDVPGPVAGADYLAIGRIGLNMLRGNSAWFGRDYSQSLTGVNVPVVSHELGQWCAYPDYDVIRKFTGYLRPGNYKIFRDSLASHGLMAKDKDFARASGRFQLACYKEEIEANLRTPGLDGFQLLDLHDYMGQGTALVGLLDPFWESKGYTTPREFRRFCNTTVLLARLKKRVLTMTDSFACEVEVAHFGPEPISNAVPIWRVVDSNGKVISRGQLTAKQIPLGKNISLGSISLDLSKLPAPRAYKLVIGLRDTSFENDWDFWLYPARADVAVPQDILMTNSWREAETRLAAGGKVLFLPRAADLDWTSPPLASVPIFWNRLMGPGWSRMLGLWCDTKHPALATFPTDTHCDWQWTELTRNVRAVNMDTLPRQLQPIIQPIDDWNRNYKLGLVFECRVGPGRLMVCSVDLESSLDSRPVARQLRHSLLDYMNGNNFQPRVVIAPGDIRSLLFDTHIMRHLGAAASADLEARGDPAANAIDGDPNTFWLAGGRDTRYPHELTISFPQPVAMSGLACMPRQNHREHEGDVREYAVEASDDGQQWYDVVRGEFPSSFAPKKIDFPRTITASHLKFMALSGFGGDNAAALAELAVVFAGTETAETENGPIQYQRVKNATPEIDE
jgi:hypothetical protein